VEITAEVGLPAEPAPWPAGSYFLPEIMGPGVALLDADGDGDLDIVQPRVPPPGDDALPTPRLLLRGDDGRFVDAGAGSGLDGPAFGQGVAVGDVDGDGDPDLYFANYGRDVLYLNDGAGRFQEATDAAGLADERWSSAATFCDYDGDGDLDLYVVHYLELDYTRACRAPSGIAEYCGPQLFAGVPDTLWRNEGGGRFRDVTDAAGLRLPDGGRRAKGLGAVCLDLTGDGRADIYVANDGEANQLWTAQGDGTFRDRATIAGVAVNRYGEAEASMGIAVGDVNGDLRPDLLLTHLSLEHDTLYLAAPGGLFDERSAESGIGALDLPFTGFGCALFDLEHDGDLDLVVVQGRVRRADGVTAAAADFWGDYAEPNLLLAGDGAGRFTDLGERGGAWTSRTEVSRGLALGDLDGDGDLDLVTSNADNTLRVFRNDAAPEGSHWLQVRALQGASDAIGATVTLTADGRERLATILPGQSYQSSGEPVAHFGLGPAQRIEALEVRWPDGTREAFVPPAPDRRVVLRRGEGTP